MLRSTLMAGTIPPHSAGPPCDDLATLARRIAGAPPGTASADEARLYRALAPRVRLYGLKHLRGAELADDLVQRVLVTAIERLRAGEVREPDRIASFVLGTSRVMAIGLRRAERHRREIVERYAATFATTTAAEEPLDLERLGECLSKLTERARAVVILTFYAERSADDIAGELTLTAPNVRVVRHRALARLRECMDVAVEEGAS